MTKRDRAPTRAKELAEEAKSEAKNKSKVKVKAEDKDVSTDGGATDWKKAAVAAASARRGASKEGIRHAAAARERDPQPDPEPLSPVEIAEAQAFMRQNSAVRQNHGRTREGRRADVSPEVGNSSAFGKEMRRLKAETAATAEAEVTKAELRALADLRDAQVKEAARRPPVKVAPDPGDEAEVKKAKVRATAEALDAIAKEDR